MPAWAGSRRATASFDTSGEKGWSSRKWGGTAFKHVDMGGMLKNVEEDHGAEECGIFPSITVEERLIPSYFHSFFHLML